MVVATIMQASNITGTFDSKPDGSVITFIINGQPNYYQINYTLTTVTLTRVATAPTTPGSNSNEIISPPSTNVGASAGSLPFTGTNSLNLLAVAMFLILFGWLIRFKRARIAVSSLGGSNGKSKNNSQFMVQ